MKKIARKLSILLSLMIGYCANGDIVRSNISSSHIRYSSSDRGESNPYITDGLVGMYDGIWNVGIGQHDENSIVWYDLVGENHLSVDSTYGVFSSGCKFSIVDCGNEGYAAIGNAAPPFETMEVVLKFYDGYGQKESGALICTGYEGRGLGQFSASWIVMSASTSNGSGVSGGGLFPSKFRYITFVYSEGLKGRIFLDGREVSVGGQAPAVYYIKNLMAIRIKNNPMDVFAIRLYSRQLTDEEIAYNHLVDVERFNVP